MLAQAQEAVSGHLVIRLFGMGDDSAKQFGEVMARQRAHIATIAKALDLKPTR